MKFLNKVISCVIIFSSIAGIVSSCVKPPEEELAAAKAAKKAALEAEVDKYMPNNYRNLGKALESAEGEIALQNSKFVLSRNYKNAINLLNNATTIAKELREELPKKKDEIKTEVEKGLVSVKKMADEIKTDIRKAPRSFGKKLKKQMASELEAAKIVHNEASMLFEAGNILDARDKLLKSQGLLKNIIDKLSTGGGKSLM